MLQKRRFLLYRNMSRPLLRQTTVSNLTTCSPIDMTISKRRLKLFLTRYCGTCEALSGRLQIIHYRLTGGVDICGLVQADTVHRVSPRHPRRPGDLEDQSRSNGGSGRRNKRRKRRVSRISRSSSRQVQR